MAEAAAHCQDVPGLPSKNLTLTDSAGRYFLLVVPAQKRVDLKKFAHIVGAKKITFAKPEILKAKLGLEPGAVSPFGLLNDDKQETEVYIDTAIYNAGSSHFHPNVNTASLVLTREMFHKFLDSLPHEVKVVEL
ncbi:prolyl-tRNA synthetase associated domain-containing protein [Candidatus Falkowbacteria bacterium]|nr:prolyl-tRNA synthetase associated domain-containing protein [Candidatus Falkowbacteria bacterium]